MITPLQPKQFFHGLWVGKGELIPHPLLRWFAPKEDILFSSQATWLSETIWVVTDRFEFSSGKVLERKMYSELIAPDRIHVTADDMPLGADILLEEKGFRFTPYFALVNHRGRTYRLRCLDQCWIDEEGFVRDIIKMYFCGLQVATMQLGPIDRNGSKCA